MKKNNNELETLTIRVVLNDTSFAVRKNPCEKRILTSFEKLEYRDGELFVKSSTSVYETNIRTDI